MSRSGRGLGVLGGRGLGGLGLGELGWLGRTRHSQISSDSASRQRLTVSAPNSAPGRIRSTSNPAAASRCAMSGAYSRTWSCCRNARSRSAGETIAGSS
jgi:hypothetical protein